jgi:osmotically-inducible protein OsmY
MLAAAGLTLLVAHGALAAATDPWITTKAKMSLLTADDVSGSTINVDTINGEVTLHGKVASQAEKAKAETLVKNIKGVTAVRNLLQVVPEARQERVTASDKEIQTNVQTKLDDHAALADVSVQSVNDGVVLLGGEVKTLGAHLRAIQVASRVPGVRRVSSEIKSPDELGDDEIYSDRAPAPADSQKGVTASATDMWTTSAVKMRLVADDRTPGLGINVDTDGDTVTLFGMVPSAAAKAAAEEDALKVSGVKKVQNDLQVVPEAKEASVKAKDADVQAQVESAISKRDDLRDADIDVEVSNGVARLTGTVQSQSQRLTAAVVARTAGGVRAVKDELRIEAN